MGTPPSDVTGLLLAWGEGDEAALHELVPLVYGQLHVAARRLWPANAPDIPSRPPPSFMKPISAWSVSAESSGRTAHIFLPFAHD